MELIPRIPKNEREFASILAGSIVKISIPAYDKNNMWTIYEGNKEGKDSFITIGRLTPSVTYLARYKVSRETLDYDANLGIIINTFDLSAGNSKEEYESLASKLKQAELLTE
ncbi:MAG: hypothetical protein Q7S27_01995 [Nanoarchaeota archaeon]|nr:hypothetical protein [Nanoarchaeota archaeon]